MQNECRGRVTFCVALPPDYSRFLCSYRNCNPRLQSQPDRSRTAPQSRLSMARRNELQTLNGRTYDLLGVDVLADCGYRCNFRLHRDCCCCGGDSEVVVLHFPGAVCDHVRYAPDRQRRHKNLGFSDRFESMNMTRPLESRHGSPVGSTFCRLARPELRTARSYRTVAG